MSTVDGFGLLKWDIIATVLITEKNVFLIARDISTPPSPTAFNVTRGGGDDLVDSASANLH